MYIQYLMTALKRWAKNDSYRANWIQIAQTLTSCSFCKNPNVLISYNSWFTCQDDVRINKWMKRQSGENKHGWHDKTTHESLPIYIIYSIAQKFHSKNDSIGQNTAIAFNFMGIRLVRFLISDNLACT